jgi:hypothetical protein
MGKVNPNNYNWDRDDFDPNSTFQPIKSKKPGKWNEKQDKKRDRDFKKFKGKKPWHQEEI